MPRELQQLQKLFQFWTILFAIGALTFFLFPARVVQSLNWGIHLFPFLNPLTEIYSPFWSVLAVSLMAMLTFVSALVAGNISDAKNLVLAVLVSKATSTLGFLIYFVKSGLTAPMLLGAGCDGTIFLVTFYFYYYASPYFRKKSEG